MVPDNCGLISRFFFTCVGVLLLFCLSIFAVGLIPCLIFRWTLTKLHVIFRPNFYKILPASSSIWAFRGIYDAPCANVIFGIKFSGELNFHTVKDKISRHILERGRKNGELLYPEFQMKLVKWLGYWFWELETEFQFQNHTARLQIPSNEDESEFVADFEKNFLKETFEKGLSPWKLVFLESANLEKPSWYLLFKFHHSLADGFSIFNAFMKCTDNYTHDGDLGKTEKCSEEISWKKWSRLINFIVTVPFDIAKSTLDFSLSKPWILTMKKATLDRAIVNSELILSSNLKKISQENKTSVSAVILAILTAGIRNVLKKQDKGMSEYISSTFPIPRQDHPTGLVNHFTVIGINLPIGVEGGRDRLRICDLRVAYGNKSTMPILFSAILEFIGTIPVNVLPAPHSIPGLQITCFAGPRQQISLNGQPAVDMHFNMWCSEISSVLLCVLSYNGGVRVIANADKAIFPTEAPLQVLVEGIKQEVDLLQDGNGRSDENNNNHCDNAVTNSEYLKQRNIKTLE